MKRTSVLIAPFEDEAKKRLMNLVAKRGKAAGIEAASKILDDLGNGTHGRAVPVKVIRELALVLAAKAVAMRAEVDDGIQSMQERTSELYARDAEHQRHEIPNDDQEAVPNGTPKTS